MIWLGIIIGIISTLVIEAIAAIVIFVVWLRASRRTLAKFERDTAGVMTPNEARATRGLPPATERRSSLTTDPTDPRLGHGVDEAPGPQNDAYLVLSEAERARGYVRPVRRSYIHAKNLEGVMACGAVTTMSQGIAETYARDPKFYGSTYCVGCRMHLPVHAFLWDGTDEVLGS